MLKIKGVD